MNWTIRARGLAARLLLVGTLATLLVAVGSTSWASSNNTSHSNVNKFGSGNGQAVKGVWVTASTSLSGPSDTQTVYTVPGNPGDLIDFSLTDFCSSSVTGGVELDVDGSFFAQTTPDHLCYQFGGREIAVGKTITCSTGLSASAGSYGCSISGALNGAKTP
jgi:hypothetical protein